MQVSLCSWEDNGNIYINLSFVLCLLLGHYQWWWHINFSALSWLYTFTNGCTACNCTEIILLNWYYSFAFNTVNLNLLNGHPCPAEGGKKKKIKKIKGDFFFFLVESLPSACCLTLRATVFTWANTSISFRSIFRLLPNKLSELPDPKQSMSTRSPMPYLPTCWSTLDTLRYLGCLRWSRLSKMPEESSWSVLQVPELYW